MGAGTRRRPDGLATGPPPGRLQSLAAVLGSSRTERGTSEMSANWRRFPRQLRVGVIAVIAITLAVGIAPVLATSLGLGDGEFVPGAGADVSYPQCRQVLPGGQAFAVVGINDGRANAANPCLVAELDWAAESVRSKLDPTPVARISLYVNTADPGPQYQGRLVRDWPQQGSNVLGSCSTSMVMTASGARRAGRDSPACAFQYGVHLAKEDLAAFRPAAGRALLAEDPAHYTWWLDVESDNSWQGGSSGRALNTAVLEGMLAAITGERGSAGIYSTAGQWQAITGGTQKGSSLMGLPEWIPGGTSPLQAATDCRQSSFTGGPVLFTQWQSPFMDGDYDCR